MYLTFLSLRNRFLYLLYINEITNITQYPRYFSTSELSLLPNLIHQLQLEQIIQPTEQFYTIQIIQRDLFLQILDSIYHSPLPISKQELRERIKNKELNSLLIQLIQSQILFEYRPQVSKKIYLVLDLRKTTDIPLIEQSIITQLHQSDKFGDQTHLKMLESHQEISSAYSDPTIFINLTCHSKWEQKLIQHLYDGLQNPQKHIGSYNEDYLTQTVFEGNQSQSHKTILKLIEKGILRCTYRNNYYLNNQILPQLKQYQTNEK